MQFPFPGEPSLFGIDGRVAFHSITDNRVFQTQGSDPSGTASVGMTSHPAVLIKASSSLKSDSIRTSSSPRPNTNLQARSLGDIEAPNSSDVESLSSDAEQVPSSRAPSVIELSSDSDDQEANPRPSKPTTRYTFPDGEVIEIESSDEEPMPSLPIPRQISSMLNPPRPYQPGGSSNMTTSRPSTSAATIHHPAPAPFIQRNHSQMSWMQGQSRPSSPESVGGLCQCPQAFNSAH
ncbi:hypothetical protein OPQ81_010990 [Rhizoctonia solani]|nr:hypothetical protein OPQ81_010990 [Rhizoctonia solani]